MNTTYNDLENEFIRKEKLHGQEQTETGGV